MNHHLSAKLSHLLYLSWCDLLADGKGSVRAIRQWAALGSGFDRLDGLLRSEPLSQETATSGSLVTPV